MGIKSKSLFAIIFVALITVACGKSNQSDLQKGGTNPPGPLVPVIGTWKGNCLSSGTQSSMLTRLVFNVNGDLSIVNHVYLLKADCSGTEDYIYRFTGKYQVGDLKQSNPTYVQNFGATLTNDVYLTLKTDVMVQAFNGGNGDTSGSGWKLNEERPASATVAASYNETLNNLRSVFANNYYTIQSTKLSIGNTKSFFNRE